MLGYADDAIIVTLALRSTVRSAGLETVRTHWPGSNDGFAALCRLTGLPGGNHTADAGDPGAAAAPVRSARPPGSIIGARGGPADAGCRVVAVRDAAAPGRRPNAASLPAVHDELEQGQRLLELLDQPEISQLLDRHAGLAPVHRPSLANRRNAAAPAIPPATTTAIKKRPER